MWKKKKNLENSKDVQPILWAPEMSRKEVLGAVVQKSAGLSNTDIGRKSEERTANK